MKEPNRDNLENFFREGAQNYNLEFVESDWLKLKHQLDREMPAIPSWLTFLRKYWILFLALLLVPVGWVSYNHFQNVRNVEGVKLSGFEEPESSVMSSNGNDDVVEGIENGKRSKTAANEEAQYTEISKQKQQNVVTSKAEEPDAQIVMPRDEVSDSRKIGQVVLGKGVDADRHISNEKLLFLSSIPPDYLIGPSIPDINYSHERQEVFPAKDKKVYFKVGLGYSPDFSTVGIGNFVSPGSRWTAHAEMGFLRRFVLSTGVVFVNNKYEAYGEDYHAPARYWKKGIVADEAYGECQMIDIPLNLRYNYVQKGKHYAFLTAGMSTYFVTSEDYYFHYEQDDPDLPKHWGTDKTTIYPFGIINLSLGYELQMTRKSGFQIEPFIKIPTTGIGWGNVDLHSMGIYFIYKYRL